MTFLKQHKMEELFKFELTILIALTALFISFWTSAKDDTQFQMLKILFIAIIGLGFILGVLWAGYLSENVALVKQNMFSTYHYFILSVIAFLIFLFGFFVLLFSDTKRE